MSPALPVYPEAVLANPFAFRNPDEGGPVYQAANWWERSYVHLSSDAVGGDLSSPRNGARTVGPRVAADTAGAVYRKPEPR